MKLSARETKTIALIGLLGVLILWVYMSYVLGPIRRELGDVSQKVREARARLKTLESTTANQATLQEQYRQVDQTVASMRSLLPAEAELPNVIAHLTDLASQSQVKIQTIFPQRSLSLEPMAETGKGKGGPVVYKETLIQIDALAGYHQLGTFLSLVESAEKPMRLASLRISSNPKEMKRHAIKMMIRAYFATPET